MRYPNLDHVLNKNVGQLSFQATSHGVFGTGGVNGLHAERPTLDQTLSDLEECASLLNEDDPTYKAKVFDVPYIVGTLIVAFAVIGVSFTVYHVIGGGGVMAHNQMKLVLPPNMTLQHQITMGTFFERVAESEWAEIHMYCKNESIAKYAEKMCCRWHDLAHNHIDPKKVYIVPTDERMLPWILEGMKQ